MFRPCAQTDWTRDGREGTYIREAKDASLAIGRLVEAIDDMLNYDRRIRIVGEMKPNEPMDQAYCPTRSESQVR